jgi:hypothetical protein
MKGGGCMRKHCTVQEQLGKTGVNSIKNGFFFFEMLENEEEVVAWSLIMNKYVNDHFICDV